MSGSQYGTTAALRLAAGSPSDCQQPNNQFDIERPFGDQV